MPEFTPYLRWLFKAATFRAVLGRSASGIRQGKKVHWVDIRDVVIRIPEPRLSKEIADFLDRECARIADVLAETKYLDASLDEAARKEVDLVVPYGLEAARLSWAAQVRTGLTLGQTYAGQVLIERPYLRVANVQADRVVLDDVKTVLVPVSVAASNRLEPGDVLMTEGGDIDKLGRGAVWHGAIADCLHQNHVFAVRPDVRRLLPDYLALVTRTSIARNYFETTATRSTNLAGTSSSKVRAFRFPLPSLAEQNRAVKRAARRLKIGEDAREGLSDLRSRLGEYRDALITECVTGQFDLKQMSEARMNESLAAVKNGEAPEVLTR